MIRALIVDDVPLFRRGLAATLEQMGDCSIVGEATQVADILDLARTHHPDVVLLSACLASASALEIAGLLLQAEQRGLFVLSEHATEEQLFLFLLAGAAAYETRWIAPAELMQKVERISR
jgi:DNA-binding NarL/FixJ family response regulator